MGISVKRFIPLLSLLMISSVSYGQSWYFEALDTKLCPNPTIRGNMAICKDRSGFAFLDTSNRFQPIPKLPTILRNSIYSAVDLGVLPDDSTDVAYSYFKTVFNRKGQHIGYAAIGGYVNSEAQFRIQVTTFYSLRGTLKAIKVREF